MAAHFCTPAMAAMADGLVSAAAMFATIALMYVGGLTINMVSLFGLIITLGIVVDDAIVVQVEAEITGAEVDLVEEQVDVLALLLDLVVVRLRLRDDLGLHAGERGRQPQIPRDRRQAGPRRSAQPGGPC